VWVSDYNYRGLFDRIKVVNGAYFVPGPTRNFRWATWNGSSLHWGARFTGQTPSTEVKTVGGVAGHFFSFDHLPGGLLIVPE
jgi:hypothetical protein